MTERVKHLVALLSIRDKLPGAQDCQMLGKVCLFDRQAFLNGAGRKFTVSQYFDNSDPGRVGKRLKNVGFE